MFLKIINSLKGLAKDLGINQLNVTFVNPYDEHRQIYFLFDWIHGYKNLRNWLLDRQNTLPGGIEVSPNDLKCLQTLALSEISNGMKLTDMHFNVKGQDRQIVKLARELISEEVSALLLTKFPHDSAKETLANLISVASKTYDILTSEAATDSSNDLKSPLGPLGMHYNEQITILHELSSLMGSIKWGGYPRFNKGIIIAINCTIQLQKHIEEIYGIPYLKTSHVTQDILERFFSIIKGMGGSNNLPTAFEFLQR